MMPLESIPIRKTPAQNSQRRSETLSVLSVIDCVRQTGRYCDRRTTKHNLPMACECTTTKIFVIVGVMITGTGRTRATGALSCVLCSSKTARRRSAPDGDRQPIRAPRRSGRRVCIGAGVGSSGPTRCRTARERLTTAEGSANFCSGLAEWPHVEPPWIPISPESSSHAVWLGQRFRLSLMTSTGGPSDPVWPIADVSRAPGRNRSSSGPPPRHRSIEWRRR